MIALDLLKDDTISMSALLQRNALIIGKDDQKFATLCRQCIKEHKKGAALLILRTSTMQFIEDSLPSNIAVINLAEPTSTGQAISLIESD